MTELDGWQTRGRSAGGYEPGRPTAVMCHHTGSPPSASGASDANYCTYGDEDAPLANLCLDRTGLVWVCAGGATNTNGKGSDWWGGGVPDDSMNSYAIGIEANGGYGSEWPRVQQDAYVTLVAALCAAYNISNHCVRAHYEWAPDRKVDPAGPSEWSPDNSSWDMDAFRVSCQNAGGLPDEEDDMPLTDDDINRIAQAVWEHILPGDDVPDENKAAGWRLRQAQGTVRHYLGAWKDSWPLPDPSLLKQIDENTR